MARYQLKHPLKLGESSTLDSLTLREHVIAADYLAFDQRGGRGPAHGADCQRVRH
jgi:hypothetical protein